MACLKPEKPGALALAKKQSQMLRNTGGWSPEAFVA